MYQSPTRVRAFFVAVAAATLLAACAGGGMNATPQAGVAAQDSHNVTTAVRTVQPSPTPTPTVAPTPAGNFDYKIVTALKMDDTGAFTEVSNECRHEARGFESEVDLSLPVAPLTALPVCSSDNDGDHDRGRGDDITVMIRTNQPPPTPTPTVPPTATPTPTPTPGVPTDLVIIRTGNGDGEDGEHSRRGRGIVVLTGTANLNGNTWTFPALGTTNDLKAEHHYRFYVAHQVPESSEEHHHHDHD